VIWKRILTTAALYLAAALLSVAILIGLFRLWRMNLHESFFYREDGLLSLTWTKNTVENGWYLDSDRLGTPGTMDNRAFPISESLHFAVMKAIALFDRDPAFVLNFYVLLTFPLSALTSLFVFRHFGCSRSTSLIGSQLFAFLPYPLMRIWLAGHIFLGACYLLPLASMVLLWVYLDAGLFFQQTSEGRAAPRLLYRRSLGALVVCLLMASAGIYYAFFYCFFLILSALRAAALRKRLYPLGIGMILIGVTALGVLGNLSPTLLQLVNRHNHLEALHRQPAEAEAYGLRIIQLVHPVPFNRVEFLNKIKDRYYQSGLLINENDSVALGVLATIGFVALLLRLLAPTVPGRPSEVFGALSRLNVFALMLGTIGGLGAVVSFSGFPFIRGYNRIAPFIGFFSIFALVLLYDRLRQPLRATRWRWLHRAALPLILLFGLYTQAGRFCTDACRRDREVFQSDKEFAQRIESELPPHAQVFEVPCISCPETRLNGPLSGYEMAKPYIHTNTLRWTYGAFDAQEAMHWQCTVREKPIGEMLTQLALADFKGVFIDRRCFPDGAKAVEAEIERLTKIPVIASKNGQLSFCNLCAYCDTLRAPYDAAAYERLHAAALNPCTWQWGDGFHCHEGTLWNTWRWSKPRSIMELTNPGNEPRWVTLHAEILTAFPDPSHLHIRSPLFADNLDINNVATAWQWKVHLPPGTHQLEFVCEGPCAFDNRGALSFRLLNFHIAEFQVPTSLPDVPE
jgi:phosphoglycerol transferase